MNHHSRITKESSESGFTLIEMIVAVGLFAVVMVICVSTLFALVNANRKAQALQSVMNNLDIALDNMTRSIKEGSAYHCDDNTGVVTGTRDCLNGGKRLIFEHFFGDSTSFADQWFYVFDEDGSICGQNRICKSENGGAPGSFFAITAPEVEIESLTFYTVGSTRGDTVQPKVVIVVKGTAATNNAKTRSTFHIQAAATQRPIDI